MSPRGFFSRGYEPVATVDPGEQRPDGAGHLLEGPFEIRGARAGQTLVIRIEEVTPRPSGETWAHGEGFVWSLDGDEDLDLAAEQATATMLDLMERELGASRRECLALASVAVDLRVTQIVNETKGVHAMLRDDAIR